jgi:hypothetical protein
MVTFYACKKLDIVRIAAVNTERVDNITSSQAKAYGKIIDLGQDEYVSDFGFCWAKNQVPTINDAYVSFGSTSMFSTFNYMIGGLAGGSDYLLRAYVTENGITNYGQTIVFKTDPGTTSGNWFKYDDGVNYDGIGITDGSDFDLAIRIPSSSLQNYNGFYVSKFRFFVKVGNPVKYSVTLWEGSGAPDLIYTEEVYNYNVEAWTEYTPSHQYVINSTKELWVGLWIVDHPAGTYPAGVDNGPAITGKGDMLSLDDGGTWETLYSIGLNYNWNMQVYVSNNKGEEKQLIIGNAEEPKLKNIPNKIPSERVVISEKQSTNPGQ